MKISHRDIKTNNIFVDNINETGRVLYVLGDMGFARNANNMMGSVVGTPGYMAPEIWAGQKYTE
jgi:serine/threonine protein kinase